MIGHLSILLPSYNNECHRLVASLAAQASALAARRRLEYEIIVADDGSADRSAVAANRRIDSLPHCRYIERRANSGRAVIRNFLARSAHYPWLVFADSDMSLRNDSFIANYLDMEAADVVYGGYTVGGDRSMYGHNLRYTYEARYEGNRRASERMKHPYDDFHTSNFLIRRDIMLLHPLDERFRRYGYEDVLFGKELRRNGIRITHIDNPLCFDDFETNSRFVAKTEEGISTLCGFRDELRGYSGIISMADRLKAAGLLKAAANVFRTFEKPIKNRLTGNNPSVLLFNIYKLGLYCDTLSREGRQ